MMDVQNGSAGLDNSSTETQATVTAAGRRFGDLYLLIIMQVVWRQAISNNGASQ